MDYTLTKTRFINGLQCPKLLWYSYHKKSDFPPLDLFTKTIFEQGTKVGLVAQQLFPEGRKISRVQSPKTQNLQSIAALKDRKPLFEAGFLYSNAYALADILEPADNNMWNLIEVKSSTGIKDEYYEDLAFQRYVFEGAGLKINRCLLLHINNEYVRDKDLDPKQFFKEVDMTEDVKKLLPTIEGKIDEMLQVLNEKMPRIQIGVHCDDPYPCRLKEICWDFIPKEDSIFALSRGKKTAFELLEKGIVDLNTISSDTELTETQKIQIEAHKSGKTIINFGEIKKFLKCLIYPIAFLDFETISPAIPLFSKSRPYERIPFQFSLYVVQKEDSKYKKFDFLWKERSDPRREFIESLKQNLGVKGSIVAYNSAFEIGVLKNICDAFPEYQEWYEEVKERFVDLYEPFRNFDYYNPKQQGIASIKQVLPALTDLSYEDLEFSSGEMASIEYMRANFEDSITSEEKEKIFSDLQKYCDLDTYGMIDVLSGLKDLIKGK